MDINMRKKLIMAASAALLSMMLSVPVYAGQWIQDGSGWWYQNDDGTYPSNGWNWLDGKCYYFMPDGYCLMNTQTPDGYTVNADGAWIVDGVVQTQGASQTASGTVVRQGSLTFTMPAGFVQDTSRQDGAFFFNEGTLSAICLLAEDMPGAAGYEDFINSYQEVILNEAVEEYVGTPSARGTKQFSTGTWYYYEYSDANSVFGIPGSVRIYTRCSGSQIQMLIFAGNIAGMDTDGIMNNNLR